MIDVKNFKGMGLVNFEFFPHYQKQSALRQRAFKVLSKDPQSCIRLPRRVRSRGFE